MTLRQMLFAAALGIFATGCSNKTAYIDLSYPPLKQVTADQPASPSPMTVSHERPVVVTVTDLRGDRGRVGSWYEDGGTSIVTGDNVEIWTFEALKYELNRLGYDAVQSFGVPVRADDSRLTVSVMRVYCVGVKQYASDVTLEASLSAAGGIAREGRFRPVPERMTTTFFTQLDWEEDTLAKAMQKSVRTMLADFGFVQAGM